MKLQYFFMASKWPFKIIFFSTLLLTVYHFTTIFQTPILFRITYSIMTLLVIIVSLFAVIPWYGLKHKGLGIENHFYKMIVPAIYILLTINTLLVFNIKSIILNIVLSLVFAFVISFNTLLILLHFKDKDPTPPSYFAKH